jgi:hypothetical protein
MITTKISTLTGLQSLANCYYLISFRRGDARPSLTIRVLRGNKPYYALVIRGISDIYMRPNLPNIDRSFPLKGRCLPRPPPELPSLLSVLEDHVGIGEAPMKT